MNYKWERKIFKNYEFFLLNLDKNYFAYFPLYHTSIKISKTAFKGASNDNIDIIDFLFSKIKDKEKIELLEYQYSNSFSPHRVDLALTTRCNLNCHYCHASSNSTSIDMPLNIALRAVDYVIENAVSLNKDYFQIGFNGGGEPTVNLELMQNIIKYARNKAKDLKKKALFGMATNGYFSVSVYDYIVDNFSHISLSIDGFKKIHDLHRPTLSGTSSYDIVFQNAKRLNNSHMKNYFIRATVSEKSLLFLEDILKFFIKEFPNAAGYSFMPINKLGRGADCIIQSPNELEYIETFKNLLLEQNICDRSKVFFMCGDISSVRSTFCDAFYGPGFNVTSDGHLASCQRDNLPNTMYFGKIENDEIIINYERLNKYKKPRIFIEEKCISCFAKYNCGGDCMDLVLNEQPRCKSIQLWIAYQIYYLHNN